tara:strand:+ start:1835 stop:2485 length:651 start_codon:yes stop_codon:yes gene_type:complete
MKLFEKVFLTGCDKSNEWMLPWWFENYRKHNTTPVIFGNFGISDTALVSDYVHAIIDLTKIKEQGWFKKPKAMLNCPAKKTVWIDSDCQVLGNIENIFDLLEHNKLNMVEDKPWTKRRGEKGSWYNSGVVGYIGKPPILKRWAEWVKDNKTEVGDQEVLYEKLDQLQKLTYINSLPNEYNWLRLQLEHDNQNSWDKKIIHWTGYKGKERIKVMMNG